MTRGTLTRWAVGCLAPQLILRREGRRGQLGARLAVDRSLWADPYPTYSELRAQGSDLQNGKLVSSTVSHALASELLRHPKFGVNPETSKRLPAPVRRILAANVDPWAVGPVEPPSMLAVNPPDHTRYRRLVSKVFTARAVAALETRVEEIAAELIDDMAGKRHVDLIESYATPLPVRVISEILGIPDNMSESMVEWGNAAAAMLEPAISYRQFKHADEGLRAIHQWLAQHLAGLRMNPGEDLMSKLAVLVDDGETLSDVELRATALLVIGAGFETTVNLIGNGVDLLLRNPDQLTMLREDPSLWTNAVDEILRLEAPVQATGRVAMEDTEVGGHHMPAGRFVVTLLAGANRDPLVFTDPDRFDVTRANARDHLSFSAGIHFCLGASLARMEGAVALRRLFDAFPDLRMDGAPQRRELRVLRGFERFPVALRADAVTAR